MCRFLTQRTCASLVVALLLSACGGGSGSDPVPAPAGGGGVSDPAPPPAGGGAASDSVPPTATLTSPADLAGALAGTLTLSAAASDNVGVSAVEFEVDGIAVGSAATPPYAVALDSTLHASGQHVVRARARDAAGNVSAWSSATVQFGGARTEPAGFTRNAGWVTGLDNASAMAESPDGRLWVAQQGGALRIVRNGALLATPFVQLTVDSTGERGLIGVALHPDFASNGWVYLHYTSPEGGPHGRISRFTVNGDVAAAGSEVKLVDLPALSSATNHNGGAIHFGPDGKLYVGVGENANAANAQNLASPLGKMLRFNDDGSIPGDNPFFASSSGLARAIWAYGLRNPFTFAFEPSTGRMHINDVGQNTWEEIDLGSVGVNYGWPTSEGPDNLTAGVTAPLFAYRHGVASPAGSGPGGFFSGIAIAGGSFYPHAGPFPAPYRGSYFFADLGSGVVGRYDVVNQAAYAFASVTGNPVDVMTGADGALYVLTRSAIVRISAP